MWDDNRVYSDVRIQPDPLPAPLRSIRSLAKGISSYRQPKELLFIKQAKLLEKYEDSYEYDKEVRHFYPTYQDLGDRELRGYFTWRSRLRNGELRRGPQTFAWLYIYELLNQIGCRDPEDGFHKLKEFYEGYGALDNGICQNLEQWLVEYAVYYDLDPGLLSEHPVVQMDRKLTMLRHLDEYPDTEIAEAVSMVSGYAFTRSRIYTLYPEEMEAVTARVCRRLEKICAAKEGPSWFETYVSDIMWEQVKLFRLAIFYDNRTRRDFSYTVDELRSYRVVNGCWYIRYCPAMEDISRKMPQKRMMGDLMRTVDNLLREAHGIETLKAKGLQTAWIVSLIREEIAAYQKEQEQKVRPVLEIDFSRLSKIREDAAVTRDKLIVGEEMPETEADGMAGEARISEAMCSLGRTPGRESAEEAVRADRSAPAEENAGQTGLDETVSADGSASAEENAGQTGLEETGERDTGVPANVAGLSRDEYRLLQSLLYTGDLSWIRREGLMLSILCDGINEKLYDVFGDTVLVDDEPVEDYVDDLKEMICP